MAIGLLPLTIGAVGGLLVWSAVQNPEGGPIQAARDLLTGKAPKAGVQKTSLFDQLLNANAGNESAKTVGGATGGLRNTVMNTAKSYIGSPYRWGGTSKSGIDCSGLVLVAYAAIGVKMSHDATSETRKGRAISESEAQPGDLIAWGSPVRYPHIALFVGPGQQIDAPTYGQTVQIRSIYRNLHGGGPHFFNVIDSLPEASKGVK